MKFYYLITLILTGIFLACNPKKKDDPVPSTQTTGKIKGNLYYIDANGNDATVPFGYTFFDDDSINRYFSNDQNGYYKINLLRQEIYKNENFIHFGRLYGDNDGNGMPMDPKETNFTFSLNKLVNNQPYQFLGTFYSMDGSRSHCTITNFSLNYLTNKLTFDFEVNIHPDDMDFVTRYDMTSTAKIIGSVDVILVESNYYD